METLVRTVVALSPPSGIPCVRGISLSWVWWETSVKREAGVEFNFFTPFQVWTCRGEIWYTFSTYTAWMNSAHRLTVIVPVVSPKLVFVTLKFFVPTRVESAWCSSFPAKVTKSPSYDDRLISSTVRFGYDFAPGGWNWDLYSIRRGWLILVMSFMTSFVKN